MDIIEEAFGVADGLHHSSNESNNSDGEGVAMFDHSCTFIYYLNPIVWWAITML